MIGSAPEGEEEESKVEVVARVRSTIRFHTETRGGSRRGNVKGER